MKQLRTIVGGVGLGLALLLAACGGDTESGTISAPSGAAGDTTGGAVDSTALPEAGPETGIDRGTNTGETATADETAAAAEAATADANILTLSIGNNPEGPRYTQGVMTAPLGSELEVVYTNPSQEAHNWVLVEPGQEQAVAEAAAAQEGNPEGIPGVIAWTPIITNDTASVRVPPLDDPRGYPYICTVPGHFEAGHKGAFNVQ